MGRALSRPFGTARVSDLVCPESRWSTQGACRRTAAGADCPVSMKSGQSRRSPGKWADVSVISGHLVGCVRSHWSFQSLTVLRADLAKSQAAA